MTDTMTPTPFSSIVERLEHTPGPWETGEDTASNPSATWIWIGPKSWATRVARVVLYDGEEEMQKANARLIAAAPEMLEALRAMLARFELYTGENDMHAGHHDKALLDLSRSAISKATALQSQGEKE